MIPHDDAAELPKLSIVCWIHSLAGGGAERVMAGLASRLSRRGHEVVLATFDDGQADRHAVDADVRRVYLKLSPDASGLIGKLRQVRLRQRRIAEVVRDLRPDVVLSFCDRTNIDVLMALRKVSVPVIVCERSEPARQSLGKFWNTMRRRSYRRAATVVALTDRAAEHLRSFSSRVCVIPSGIDPPQLLSDRSAATKNKCIVGAGRLEIEKGFDRLVEAFAQATATSPEWKLVIFGEGSLRQALQDQCVALGIDRRVEFPGWVSPLQPELAKATLFCLSSRYEGFPSVLLEAMSMGVPAISVDCESGPRQIIEHGLNGLLVEPSATGLANGLARWIRDAEHRETLAEAGRNVFQRYSFDAMTDQFENLLQLVVEERRND